MELTNEVSISLFFFPLVPFHRSLCLLDRSFSTVNGRDAWQGICLSNAPRTVQATNLGRKILSDYVAFFCTFFDVDFSMETIVGSVAYQD
jgi:hypothetical protein